MSGLAQVIEDFLILQFKFSAEVSSVLVSVISVVFIILCGVIAVRVIRVVINKSLKVSKKNVARSLTIAKLLKSVARYVVWFIVAVLVLEQLQINITPFLASAGVIGLAIGFGAQELVKDIISGFFIIFEGSFVVDDVVEADGFKGKVLSLGLRTTVIQNWKGERKIIQNGSIGSVVNFSKNDSVALIDFGVAYDTDLVEFKNVIVPFLEETDEKYEDIIEPPTFLGVIELANSSINMRIMCKTHTMKHFQVERDVRSDLVGYLRSKDIEIPFPQVVVHNA